MDRISRKDQTGNFSQHKSLSQPLELRESLRIRDGLGAREASPVRWPESGAIRLTVFDLEYLEISNN